MMKLRLTPYAVAFALLCSVAHADDVKTYKVVLSKSSAASNRTVYIQAKDSSEAKKTAQDQNEGWTAEYATEEKEKK